MAFTRAFLKAQGLEKEQVDAIMEAHAEVTDSLKAERDGYKEDAQRIPTLEKEIEDLKTKAADDGYKDKYEKEHKAFEDYKADVTSQKEKAARETEAKRILKDLKIPEKYFDKIIKYSSDEIAQLKIDSEGKVTGADAFKAVIDSDWSDYKTEEGKKGADTATPPVMAGKGKAYSSKDEVMAIKDPVARQQAIADNHELFGI